MIKQPNKTWQRHIGTTDYEIFIGHDFGCGISTITLQGCNKFVRCHFT